MGSCPADQPWVGGRFCKRPAALTERLARTRPWKALLDKTGRGPSPGPLPRKDSALLVQQAWVQSLVRELRSCQQNKKKTRPLPALISLRPGGCRETTAIWNTTADGDQSSGDSEATDVCRPRPGWRSGRAHRGAGRRAEAGGREGAARGTARGHGIPAPGRARAEASACMGREPGTFRGRQRGQRGLEQRPETPPSSGHPPRYKGPSRKPTQLSPFARAQHDRHLPQVRETPALPRGPDHAGWAESAPQASGLLS